MTEGNVMQTDASREAKSVTPKGKAKEATRRIILENNDAIPSSGLPVGVNGKHYLIRPGVEVEVPVSVLEVLKNAIVSVPEIDPRTRQVSRYRDKMKYPFQYVG